MRIYTSSWFTALPPAIVRVGISRSVPAQVSRGIQAELAPGPWFRSASPDEYHARYMAQLAQLDPLATIAKIERMAEGRDAALVCFEAPAQARRVVSSRAGFGMAARPSSDSKCESTGWRTFGYGWAHPKLHISVRR